MDPLLAVQAIAAGIVYVVTPGPATLAVLGLTAAHGRGRAARFLIGHAVGDVTWAVLALAALVGASRIGPGLFQALGVACGLYLIVLGWRALTTRSDAEAPPVGAGAPLRTGILFGLTNPKAYPFSLAMFGALAVQSQAGTMTLGDAAALLAAVSAGFVIGSAISIGWTGLPPVRRLFARFRVWIVRLTGLIFIAFGAKALADASGFVRAR
ncbi:LysE family translocator [Prosthecodimorpha staleyi]|uniref:LysE family translocator n=1 Tax=Prosthecodimorpha staleyi TaxID=2840188 RepID=A0A947DBE5_9HYPH|nr:LysE family translocator [Prosthecodimorpha staleyi]MBT9292597.1 LysE family translocator [Prosthecodimorpha staleyi]